MKFFSRPVGEKHKTHNKAEATTNSYCVNPFMSHFQHIINSIARHSYQVIGQEEYNNSVVIVLLDVGEESQIRTSSP